MFRWVGMPYRILLTNARRAVPRKPRDQVHGGVVGLAANTRIASKSAATKDCCCFIARVALV